MWNSHSIFLSAFIIGHVCCMTVGVPERITVMTFNIWNSGQNVQNGLLKIAKHISFINPDVVALQEVETELVTEELIEMLGPEWSGATHKFFTYPDTALITRHKIIEDSVGYTSRGLGARIRLVSSNRTIHVYCLHLDYRSYGPYAANNKLVSETMQIMAGERNIDGNGRFENMREFVMNSDFREALRHADAEPVVVCGDFNAPSHLDWINETAEQHGGWAFEWPSTKMLEGAQMVDSFRKLHPNPLTKPGNTWSTVEKKTSGGWGWTIPEPQDRIDFIFYKGTSLQPIKSTTYQGRDVVWPKPYHWHNDYPSDHFAVITTFALIRGY